MHRASRLSFCGAVQLIYKVEENFDAEIVLFFACCFSFYTPEECLYMSFSEGTDESRCVVCMFVFMFIFIFVY